MDLTQVISACLNNDRVAQKRLYDSYKDNLFTIVMRLTNDHDLSADLLQETFISAFKSLSSLKEPKFFHSWIKQILVRKTYSHFRKKIEAIVDIDNIDIGYTDHLDVGYIEQAIKALPYKSRTVFVMCEIEGFSHKEIAETLDISVGTSKSQLHYAKSKLKDALRPHLYE